MVLRRSGLSDPFGRLRDELDRQVADLWSGLSGFAPRLVAGRSYPAIRAWDSGDALHAEAEVPGLKTENLEISVVGSELTIKGARPDVVEEGATYHRRERETGTFTRVLR